MSLWWLSRDYKTKKLEEILLENLIVTESQLNWARINQAEKGGRIEDILLESGIIDEKSLALSYSLQFSIPLFEDEIKISENALKLVPDSLLMEYNFLPVSSDEKRMNILICAPCSEELFQDLSNVTRLEIFPLMVEKTRLHQARKALTENKPSGTYHQSAIQLFTGIMETAWKKQATDIHLEYRPDHLCISLRINGELLPEQTFDLQTSELLITRLKIVSNLDITEHFAPQEGQFSLLISGSSVNFRCSVLPGYYGENASIRILNRKNFDFSLDNLGIEEKELSLFSKILRLKYGLVLVCGATGSGKTTTLYSGIRYLKQHYPGKKIITIEDPIEYPFADITQTQVNYSRSENRYIVSFSSGLKSILRHDPDIIMIGEIRDEESAMIAINAAITGHLVLATIHAGDVFEVINRINYFKIPPNLFIESIQLLISQTLVKKLCPSCRFPRHFISPVPGDFYEASGCRHCQNRGYIKREGVFEFLQIDDKIKDAVMNGLLPSAIRKIAVEGGFRERNTHLRQLAAAGEISYQDLTDLTGASSV